MGPIPQSPMSVSMHTALAQRRRKAVTLPIPSAEKARIPRQPNNRTSDRHDNLAALLSADGSPVQLPVNNGSLHAQRNVLNEARAIIGHRDVDIPDAATSRDVVEISSGNEEDESDLESSVDGQLGKASDDTHLADGKEAIYDAAEIMSFGELLKANAPETVEVEAAVQADCQDLRIPAPLNGDQALSAPSATSLSAVLSQALKTNDKELLGSCFEMNDLNSVRSTIERLPSSLVANLLRKLAEQLHKRPGRAGNLMVWVQWSIVSHGGYLAGRQDIMKELSALNRVIKERASGLQSLLALKGKLDMLSAQLELRRRMQNVATMDEDGEDVIYVEGQSESEFEDEDSTGQDTKPVAISETRKKTIDTNQEDYLEDDDSSDEDSVLNLNIEEVGDDEASEEEDDILDEAEETESDTNELEGISFEGEDLSEDELETSRPLKRSTVAQRTGFCSGRRH